MDLDRTTRTLSGIGLGGLGSLFVAAGLVGVRGEVSNVNVALVLVLVVLAAARLGGRTAGAFSGVVAATSFDFFHTRPYGLLKIADGNDVVTTLLLLIVGLVMGEVVERSARFKDRMQDDRTQLRRFHRVAALAASEGHDDSDLIRSVSAELIDTLHLDGCTYESPPFLSELPYLELDGRRRAYRLPTGGVDLRVVGQHGIVGRFVLTPKPGVAVSAERVLVAISLAHAVGLALTPAV